MPDLNKRLAEFQDRSNRVRDDITKLLLDYEGLLHEVNGIYMSQRLESGPEGLDDFYRLIQLLKRNRDVVGSMTRGIGNMRPTNQFKFIEEDLEKEKEKQEKEKQEKKKKKKPEPEQAKTEHVLEDFEEKQPETING